MPDRPGDGSLDVELVGGVELGRHRDGLGRRAASTWWTSPALAAGVAGAGSSVRRTSSGLYWKMTMRESGLASVDRHDRAAKRARAARQGSHPRELSRARHAPSRHRHASPLRRAISPGNAAVTLGVGRSDRRDRTLDRVLHVRALHSAAAAASPHRLDPRGSACSTASGCATAGADLRLQPGVQRLLAFLALHDRPLQRPTSPVGYGPTASRSTANASLRTALWRLRRPGCASSRRRRAMWRWPMTSSSTCARHRGAGRTACSQRRTEPKATSRR